MKKKLLLIASLCIGYTESFFDIEAFDREHQGRVLLTQDQVNQMYQLMKDVHELFGLYGIEYWVEGGTLLGAVRHEGLMWWDDDFDICLLGTDLYRVMELEPLLNELGYVLERHPMMSIAKEGVSGVDIFTTFHTDNYTQYVHMWWTRDGRGMHLYDWELYPLKLYKFGDFEVWGPNDCHTYFRCGMGNEYMQKVYIYNHKKTDWIMCYLKELAIKYQKAATMTVPLENRVSKLFSTQKN